jgi:hypothetical protein
VAVITARGARPAGFTSTSLTSVAVTPPLVSFNIALGSSSWQVFAGAEHVGVHFPTEEQHELAARFSQRGIDIRMLTEGVRRTELVQQRTGDLPEDIILRPYVRVVPLKGARSQDEGRIVPLTPDTARRSRRTCGHARITASPPCPRCGSAPGRV